MGEAFTHLSCLYLKSRWLQNLVFEGVGITAIIGDKAL